MEKPARISKKHKTVQFYDTSSDSGKFVVSRNWSFGDGNYSTEQNPTHAYTSSVTYTATLEVIDNHGGVNSISKIVPVDVDLTFGKNFSSGWNLISAPYGQPVNKTNILVNDIP